MDDEKNGRRDYSSRRQAPFDVRRRRRRPTSYRADAVFKLIVALESAFLLFMWLDPFVWWSGTVSSPTNRTEDRSNFYHKLATRISNQDEEYTPTSPTLIVGGSDGSGTRAIAKTLKSLGVDMKMDDKQTFDVHAPDRSQGWTRLVNMVLNETRSTNYEIDDLSNKTRSKLLMLLRNGFWKTVKAYRLTKSQPLNLTGIFVAFKAPATMVLLPLLKEVIGPVKFIHVVRDGRDIAL